MSADPFEHDDAAYVLGALDPTERSAFEHHLLSCDACTARVAAVRTIPSLLSGISIEEIVSDDAELPETLLPGLIRRAAKERRSSRRLFAGVATVAAAAVAALVVVAWPSGGSTKHVNPAAMRQLVPSPVTATAELVSKASGTYIEVTCRYSGAVDPTAVYWLVVHDKANHTQKLSSWTLQAGQTQEFDATTALRRSDISSVEITYQGRAILGLKT